jgi:hypothetical protein
MLQIFLRTCYTKNPNGASCLWHMRLFWHNMTFVNFQLNSWKKKMSLPQEALSRNYWKYHFVNVLLKFHLLIDIVIDLVFESIKKIFFVISHSLLISIIITERYFLLVLTKMICYKNGSNFAPNNERLFLFLHLFPTCSLQVPNGFPLGFQYIP